MPEPKPPDVEQGAIAARIREQLARKRLSRASLAAEARISLSSLEKALAGDRRLTFAMIVRIEEALGVALRSAGTPGIAPETLGGYARAAVSFLEGRYLTIRPSFGDPGDLYVYVTEIRWEDADGRLVFREQGRLDSDFAQAGEVSVPHQTGHIYLVTNRHGQYRLAVLSRPTIAGTLHGLLTTLQQGRGAQLTPVSMPIVLDRLGAETPPLGNLAPDHPRHAACQALMERTLKGGFASQLS